MSFGEGDVGSGAPAVQGQRPLHGHQRVFNVLELHAGFYQHAHSKLFL